MQKTLLISLIVIFLFLFKQSYSQSNAGPDQEICSDYTYMAAIDPTPNTGYWTVLSGSGTFTDPTLYNTLVTGIAQGSNEYRWEVTIGVDTYADGVIITNNSPSIATITGPIGTETCDGTITLTANLPAPYYADNQYWSIGGGGGTFNDSTTSFTMDVTNLNPGNNIFVWTVERGICPPSSDNITIVNNQVDAVAGPPQTLCVDNTNLNATDPSTIYPNQGTGQWENISMNSAIIENPLQNNTSVSNIPSGTTTLQWTVELGSCSMNDLVQISNNSVIATANNQTDCDGTFILDGNDPSSFGGTGFWEIVDGGSGTISAPSTLYNTTITGISNGVTTTLRWNVDNGICTDDIDITVTNMGFDISAGPDVSDCSDTYTFNADDAAPGTGFWTLVAGSGTISSLTQYNAVVTGLSQGYNVFRWTVLRGGCYNFDEIIVENTNPDVAIITAPGPLNREVCTNSVTVQGNMPSFGTGLWTLSSGEGTFSDASNFQTLVTGLLPGSNTFTWNISNGTCISSADVTIINNEVASEAGPNQILCADVTTLNAINVASTYPFQGVGHWTNLSANGAVIANSLLQNSGVSNLPVGTTTFQWTVEKSICSVSDNVLISNNSVNAMALDAQTCNSDVISLTGNIPGPVESGQWTCFTPGVTYDDQTLYNTGAHNLVVGINNFTWTINNADCSDAANIVITSIDPNADAGADQNNLCVDFTFLGAANPAPGNGVWTVLAGLGTFANASDNGTYVSGIQQGTNVYRWTVTESGCVETSDVTIINNLPSVGAGPDQSTCINTVTLSGINPGGGETGLWTQIAGFPANITDDALHNTTVTGLSNGVSVFEWTISNSLCSASDHVTITFNEVIADAGLDNSTCDGTFALMAVDPTPGIGYWEIFGTGTLSHPTLFNSNVSGLSQGPNTLRWHVSYAGCSDDDDVVITNNEVTVSAGLDQNLCTDNTILVGNNPVASGSGIWTKTGGSGTISNPSFYNSAVTGLSNGANLFTWTITEGLCSNSDEVQIFYNQLTTNAGVDQNTCETYATLSALAPQIGESGYWTVAGGTAVFDNSALYTTDVTGLVQGDNRLVWTLTNGLCNARDTVVVTNNSPTVSNVSADAEICSNIYTLVGNSTAIGETGLWTAEFGASATIVDPTNNITTAHSIGAGSNTFRWTISNALCDSFDDIVVTNNTITGDAGLDTEVCTNFTEFPITENNYWTYISGCGSITENTISNVWEINLCQGENELELTVTQGICSASDMLVITNNSVQANAGPDQIVCDGTAYLLGNNPSIGTGEWTRLGGAGNIENPTLYNTLVTGLSSGGNTFRWSITEGMCESHDDVIITNELVFASAGMDETVCTNYFEFPIEDNHYWSYVSGCGSITENTTTNVWEINLCQGENELELTVTQGICSASDRLVITNNSVEANAGLDVITCGEDANLSANDLLPGETGLWTIIGGSGTILTPSNNETIVTNQSSGVSVYQWTVNGNACTDSDIVQVNENSFLIETGPAQTVCSDEGSLFILEFTEWELELTEGCAAFVDTIDNQVFFTDLCLGENVFVFTAYLNGCYASDSYIINNSSVEANAGPDETITTDSYQLKGENPYQGIGTWSVLAGSGIFDDDELYNTIVSELSEGENVFNWTVSLNNCTDSDDVTITYNPLGVEDLNSIFKVFPNPTDGLISISSTTDLSDAVFELKNIAGQEVQYKMIEQTSHAFGIDLSNLAYGVYFLKINLKGETKMLRLVKK